MFDLSTFFKNLFTKANFELIFWPKGKGQDLNDSCFPYTLNPNFISPIHSWGNSSKNLNSTLAQCGLVGRFQYEMSTIDYLGVLKSALFIFLKTTIKKHCLKNDLILINYQTAEKWKYIYQNLKYFCKAFLHFCLLPSRTIQNSELPSSNQLRNCTLKSRLSCQCP